MSRLWTHAQPLDARAAWARFLSDPSADSSAAVRRGVGQIARVVDAGCGAGQELLPYLDDAVCVGVDVSAAHLALAGERLRAHQPRARVALVRAAVEALPLRAQWADVVICRLVLPYTDNRRALREIARVLRPGGALVVSIHHYRYYLRTLARGLRAGDLRPTIYALRVLLSGLCFHLTGTQRTILGMRETYLTTAQLQRLAAAAGLALVAELPGGSAFAPQLLLVRAAPSRSVTAPPPARPVP